MKIVCVHWHDSSLEPKWSSKSDEIGITKIVSAGYLIRDNDIEIQIAQSYYKDGDMFSAIQSIPKSVITKIKTIK